MKAFPGRRIIVVGTTGSGKTTVARRLAELQASQHVELDAFHWDSGWTPCPRDAFRERVARATSGESWVADGNYGAVRDILWTRADTLVWLDYPLVIALSRLLRRSVTRIVSGEELWNGNRESFRNTLLDRDSLLVYAVRTHQRRRRQYTEALAQPSYHHLRIVRHRSPPETAVWLKSLL